MILDYLKQAYEFLMRCIFPKKCPICHELIPITDKYCKCSFEENEAISNDFCIHCGYDTVNCTCEVGNTVKLPAVAGIYIYKGKIKFEICDFKFNNMKSYADKLGTEMAFRVANAFYYVDFDVVTFTPMSKESKLSRGYNQSELLAKIVAKRLFIPCEDLLDKVRDTKSQHTLSGKERTENLKNSVKVKSDVSVKGKNILLCDDVKTTGSTLKECVDNLLNAGAQSVYCICIALSDFR